MLRRVAAGKRTSGRCSAQIAKKKHARKKLKETINNAYFRMSIPYIKKNGTIDMKIEAVCLQIRSYNLFKKILKLLNWLKKRHRK